MQDPSSSPGMAAWKHLVALPEFPINIGEAALVIIDMTKQQASRDHGICRRLIDEGYESELEYYLDRIQNVAVPAIVRLADCFRAHGRSVAYTRCASLVGDGSDQTARHRAIGLVMTTDSEEAEFLHGLEPVSGDIVLNKTGSSVFNSTNYEHLLRNMRARTLVVSGIFTNSCVEGAIRDAGDLDFQVLMGEDACAAMSPAGHANAIQYLDKNFCHVRSTDEIVKALETSAGMLEAEVVR